MTSLYTPPLEATDDGRVIYNLRFHQNGYDGGLTEQVTVGPNTVFGAMPEVDFETALADFANALKVAGNFDIVAIDKIAVSATTL